LERGRREIKKELNHENVKAALLGNHQGKEKKQAKPKRVFESSSEKRGVCSGEKA